MKTEVGQQEGRKRTQGGDEERHVCAMCVGKCLTKPGVSCANFKTIFQNAVSDAGEFFKGGIKKQLMHEIFDISVNKLHVKKDNSESNFSQ